MRRCILLAVVFEILCLGVGRVDSATAEAPASVAAPPTEQSQGEVADEAVIDMARVFEKHTAFNAQIQKLKDRIRELEREIQTSREQFNRLEAQLKSEADPDEKVKLEKQAANLAGTLGVRIKEVREQLMVAEARVYNDTYKAICAAVARHAREHGIRIVRRIDNSHVEIDVVTSENRQQVLKQINREVVYRALDSRDITDAIIERLNAESAADVAERTPTAE